MSERVIPLLDVRQQVLAAPLPQAPILAQGQLSDHRGRPLRDLRISVTDRCNFRCTYCMPKEVFDRDHRYLKHSDLLSFEEITRLARVFVAHGVQKLRLTGGEPLLRKDLHLLVDMLAQLRTPSGQPLDLTLTTNGALLARQAQTLKDAGLQRVSVSLDGLDDAVFRHMNDVDFPVAKVLEGIEAARQSGLGRDAAGHYSGLKINMVVKRSSNLDQVLAMARYFRGQGVSLRFIEYMDVGNTNGWQMAEVVPSAELVQRISTEFALMPLPARDSGETAQRWGYVNDRGVLDPSLGELGFISSVTQAFCGDCNRARLSMEGRLFLCLFASQGYDLRALLRGNTSAANDEPLTSAIAHIWQQRQDRYSELRASAPRSATASTHRIEMSYIGG